MPSLSAKEKHSGVSPWFVRSAATIIGRLDLFVLLADVLSGQSAAALTALEAGDVPLPLQSQQGLTLLDLLAAAGAVYSTTEETRGKSGSADAASRSGLQDDLRQWWRRRTVCRWLR